MKKALLLIVLIVVNNISVYALSAQSSVLMDFESRRVLMENNAHLRRGMASTTKIMTAIVALEKGNLDDIVTVSYKASTVEGSSMWLKSGEEITLRSLLYGLMLNSGNDAATAIAEHIGGSIEGFAVLMNDKAKELGLKDTSFTNPHGLDDENHYTTAYELGIITCYAMENEVFCDIVNTKRKTIEGLGNGINRTLTNHNKMLTLYDNADGVKTGFTKKCGRCLVSSATKDDLKLIAVTLNAPDDWNDHKTMLDFGFDNYYKFTGADKNSYIRTVSVTGGKFDKVSCYAKKELSVAVKENEKTEVKFNLPECVKAPVIIGQKLGTAEIYVDGKLTDSIDVVAGYGVNKKLSNSFFDVFYFLSMELLSKFVTSV
ncbi:MAG: D-alanyl-D-alanine carboxypeptidase [Clostridia bacterium]|nr:D-alanyl-D-alanine carboxypeptidase [Clostridia bacterium]